MIPFYDKTPVGSRTEFVSVNAVYPWDDSGVEETTLYPHPHQNTLNKTNGEGSKLEIWIDAFDKEKSN